MAEKDRTIAEKDKANAILRSLIPFRRDEQKAVRAYAVTRLIELLGGKESALYESKLGTVRSAMWRDYWREFKVKSYLATPLNYYEIVFIWIDEWNPEWVRKLK